MSLSFIKTRRRRPWPLALEITVLLLVKVTLLTVLARSFFSEPEARHMRMPSARVAERMLAPADATPAAR
jgi:hypothetical protein